MRICINRDHNTARAFLNLNLVVLSRLMFKLTWTCSCRDRSSFFLGVGQNVINIIISNSSFFSQLTPVWRYLGQKVLNALCKIFLRYTNVRMYIDKYFREEGIRSWPQPHNQRFIKVFCRYRKLKAAHNHKITKTENQWNTEIAFRVRLFVSHLLHENMLFNFVFADIKRRPLKTQKILE